MRTARHSFTFALSLVLALGVVAMGCDSSGSASSAEGRFTLNLTDAPADLDSAVVTVDRVTLAGADAEDDGDDGDDDSDDGEDDDNGDDGDEEGVVTLTDSTRQIDLLRLQDGVSTTLADVTVPAGEYTQLRFVLGSPNYVVTSSGDRQMLQVPSGQQSGIKIVLPGETEIENDGDRLEVTLDFDVEDSFVEQGNGQYLFKPTVRVKSVRVNGEAIETVSVSGAVSAASSDEVAVDGIPFAVTDQTEFDGDNGATTPAGLQPGDIVEVEGSIQSSGPVEALEIEVEDDDEVERSITAPLQSVSTADSTISQLGVTVQVTDSTEFDDDGGLRALETGSRVETDYVLQSPNRLATEIEQEDD